MPAGNRHLIVALVAVYALVVITIVAAGIGGIMLVDTVRGYVAGEGYYSKAQKGAVIALESYTHSRDPADFAEYRRLMAVPISARRARERLEDPARPVAESHALLEAAQNHPDDVAGLAWLFRHFGETAMLAPAIAIWRDADAKIDALDETAGRLQRAVRSGGSEAAIDAHRARILALDAELTAFEAAFSESMGETARRLGRLLVFGIGGLGGALALLGSGFGIHVMRRTRAAADQIGQREERFRHIAELSADWIWESDAEHRLCFLSDRIEEVTGMPKKTFLGRRRWEIGGAECAPGWAAHAAAMQGHESLDGFEYSLPDAGGSRHFFRLNGKPIFAADGHFVGYRGTGTDVTAEVTARREAERRHELLETVFENLGHGISVVDADLRVVLFNRLFLDLLGFPADRFAPGDPFEAFLRYNAERGVYGPGDVDELVRERIALVCRPEPHRLEHAGPDGQVVEIRGQPLPSGGFVSIYRDVTAERRSQAALEASERRTRMVIDRALDAIVTIDAKGRVLEFNLAAEAIFGRSRRDVLGLPIADLVVPERHRARHLAGFARYLETGESAIIGGRVELSALHADGTEFPAELAITTGAGDDAGDEAATFIGFLRDITRRKRAEEARRRAEERLWAFLDASPEAISFKDDEGRYIMCNKAFERTVGVPKEKLVGLTDGEVLDWEPPYLEAMRRHERLAAATRQPVRQERDHVDPDGRTRTFAVTKFPILDDGDDGDGDGGIAGIGSIAQDVTGLKHTETQLRQAMKMQAIGQLTGGVSHDFNNLLAVVLGNLELLREQLGGGPGHDLAERAMAAAQRGATLTRRLLAFARQQPLKPQAVDVEALLGEMADLIRQSLGEAIGLSVRCDAGLPPCFVDMAELETALLNLAINARDAMPGGGELVFEASVAAPGALAPEVLAPGDSAPGNSAPGDSAPGNLAPGNLAPGEVGTGTAGHDTAGTRHDGAAAPGHLVITVRDTGSGMSREILDRVFEPFFTTKPVGMGSGLGLSMVYGFARQSGGHLAITSEPGRGTAVALWLPTAAGAPGAPGAPGAAKQAGAEWRAVDRRSGPAGARRGPARPARETTRSRP
ncbi:MAG TPA: PAS domain S-box protein [Thermohalobaculum sp.]|nr:PAS domain S-box protein [Thermohalobaculum sp.]